MPLPTLPTALTSRNAVSLAPPVTAIPLRPLASLLTRHSWVPVAPECTATPSSTECRTWAPLTSTPLQRVRNIP
jgi:hypothetical protein